MSSTTTTLPKQQAKQSAVPRTAKELIVWLDARSPDRVAPDLIALVNEDELLSRAAQINSQLDTLEQKLRSLLSEVITSSQQPDAVEQGSQIQPAPSEPEQAPNARLEQVEKSLSSQLGVIAEQVQALSGSRRDGSVQGWRVGTFLFVLLFGTMLGLWGAGVRPPWLPDSRPTPTPEQAVAGATAIPTPPPTRAPTLMPSPTPIITRSPAPTPLSATPTVAPTSAPTSTPITVPGTALNATISSQAPPDVGVYRTIQGAQDAGGDPGVGRLRNAERTLQFIVLGRNQDASAYFVWAPELQRPGWVRADHIQLPSGVAPDTLTVVPNITVPEVQ